MTLTRTLILLAVITVIGAYCVSAGPSDYQPCDAVCVAKVEAH